MWIMESLRFLILKIEYWVKQFYSFKKELKLLNCKTEYLVLMSANKFLKNKCKNMTVDDTLKDTK